MEAIDEKFWFQPLTVEDLIEQLNSRYSLVNSPIDLDIIFTKLDEDSVQVKLVMQVPDRDTGEIGIFSNTNTIKRDWSLVNIDSRIEWAVKNIFVHEFKEAFHINGIRVLDPHKDDK